jgi:hypothetical protein
MGRHGAAGAITMAIDPRKRQKKLERRKAKAKAERRELARRESQGLPPQLQRASTAPVLHCCVGAEIWRQGIGQVLVSRQLDAGKVAFAVFLVDMYCLGVKDAFANITSRARYDAELYGKLIQHGPLTKLLPECARKLVEGSVQYAAGFGLSPHTDYYTAKLILGDIAAEACTEEYVFGKDGKPFFVAGPHDDAIRCELILRTLHHHCGPDGHHFLIPAEIMPDEV